MYGFDLINFVKFLAFNENFFYGKIKTRDFLNRSFRPIIMVAEWIDHLFTKHQPIMMAFILVEGYNEF